jgi:hypothetical protein
MERINGQEQNQKRKHALIFCVVTTLVIYQWSASIRYYSCPLTVKPTNTCNINVSIPQAYNMWIQTELGESMRVAKLATGNKPNTFQTMTPGLNPNRFFFARGNGEARRQWYSIPAKPVPSNTRWACTVLQRRWTCISRLPGGTLPRYIHTLLTLATVETIA